MTPTKLLIGSLAVTCTALLAGCQSTSTPTSTAPVAGAGEHCGGNMANAATCAAGYHCAPDPASTLPFGDVGGTCVAN